MHKLRKSKGFTLIELMVVVAIIGILAAVAVPKFLAFLARSRKSEARTMLSGVFVASEGYFAEYEYYGGGDNLVLWRIGFTPAGAIKIFDAFKTGSLLTCSPGENTSDCALSGPMYESSAIGSATDKVTSPSAFSYAMAGNIDADSNLDLWTVSQLRRQPCNMDDDLTAGTNTDDANSLSECGPVNTGL